MTKLKENTSEKSEMIADLKEKALNKFKKYLQAINLWLFIWPFWAACATYSSHPSEDLTLPIFCFLYYFIIFGILSLWPKKKKSIASAYAWLCINLLFVLSFLFFTALTPVAMLISVGISSAFFYYFWMGISAFEWFSDLKNIKQ